MNSRYTRARLWLTRCAVALASLVAVALATPAQAQTVELNPATIQGTVTLTGQTLSNFSVSASWTDNSTNPPTNYSASTSVSNSNSYSLIVNVPQGSTPTYTVSVYANVNGSNQSYYFTSQTVDPDPTTPKTLDFTETPAFLQGTVTATGGTLNYFYVYTGSGYGYFYNTSTYSLLIHPGTNIYAYGYGYGQYGGNQFDQGFVYFDVAAGDTATLDWTVTLPGPPPTGEIDGTFSLAGAVTPSQFYFAASGPSYNSSGTSPFQFPNLNAGSYYLYSYAYFGSTYLGLPDSAFSPSRYVNLAGGATLNVSASATEAFLNGTLTIGGTTTLADTSSVQINAYGASSTNASGGYAGTTPAANGAYSLVVTDGGWSPYYFSFNYSKTVDPANYLYEQLYFYDYNQYYNPITLSAGDTVTKNLTYATGNITVNFQALGNATFSSPNLNFTCQTVDPITQQTKTYYYGYAYNYSLSNVSSGGVTFTGMAGDCTIQAAAYANGSNYVTFGTIHATMVPGTIQVIDIGGPSLVVNFPEANYLTTLPSIVVTGTANDESVDIASITVNGNAATFASTNNPLHQHEVSFSATVPSLNLGANTLTTVVTAMDTDVAGKQASDTRTVFYDPGPLTLAFTPADGAVSNTPDITIDGTASDPAGITSILVNGSPVTFTPGSSASFSVPFTLVSGENFITVVASGVDADDAHPGQTITQTHKVTFSEAPAKSNPIVSAAGGSFIYDGLPHAGSGSAIGGQGESLPVTLTYTGTGGTVYGPTSQAPVDAGTYQVVAHTDGNNDTFAGNSSPASLVISYQLCATGAAGKPKQSGSTIPIKVQLCSAVGVNVSSASVVLHATGIQLVAGTANGTLQDSGNANPGMNFRLVGPPAAYMFNLQTKGFASGSYNLQFTIGSDPTVYTVPFAVR